MIIGFSGGMGSGKSTALKILVAAGLKNVELIKFAQPLYDMQEQIYRRIKSVYTRPEDFKKDRKLLQWLGTEWGRGTISESLWVDIWKADATQAMMQGFNVVCDDVRFDNEAKTIHDLGGIVIQLTRKDNTVKAEGGEGLLNHPSESGLTRGLVDYTIQNNGTLEEFSRVLKSVLLEATGQKLQR